MLTISIKHPDAEDFIDAKLTAGKVTGANVSVRIDDEFMNAVKNDTNYIQTYPIDVNINNETDIDIKSMEYNELVKGKYGYYKKINPKKMWDKIIHNAWKSAEPGILFWDTIINESVPDCYADLGFKTVSTNPSLRHDTLVLTKEGVFPIKYLAENNSDVIIRNILGEWQPAKVFMSGKDKQLFEISFTNGQKIYATEEHKHPIFNTSGNIINSQTGYVIKKQTTELKRGDKIYLPSFTENPINCENNNLSFDDGFVCGWLTGDGWVSWHKTNNSFNYGFVFSETDKKYGISDKILNFINNKIGDRKISLRENNRCYETCVSNKIMYEYFENIGLSHKSNGIPEVIWKSNHEFISGYIDGIFSNDGYVDNKKVRIILTSIHEKLLLDLQKLLSFYGIRSNIIKSFTKSNFSADVDRKYVRYDLYIATKHAEKFANIFTLTHKDKNEKLKLFINKDYGKFSNDRDYLVIKSVTKTDLVEDVYDITVFDNTHTFQMEGGITGNCGEITLSESDSCRLLALNLYGYVVNPFTSESYFNWELFKKDVIIAQRYMDDIIDLEIEKIDKILNKIKSDPEDDFIKQYEYNLWERIKQAAVNGRRTGLGITAEGDMLAALGFTYGTDEGNDFSDNLHKTLKLEAYRSSVILAKERGTFPIYDANRELNNPFIDRIKNEDTDLYTLMQKFGRRNIALLTIAPTGSVSILTQTTSGIEPVFLPAYTRRRKINPQEKNVRIDFVDDDGISWQEYPIFHHKFETWLKVNGYNLNVVKSMSFEQVNELVKKSPYYKATSNDVNWVKKVEMQGMIQKHIDHSISVTVNLPNDISEEMIGNVYKTGYNVGCKGITVYRDGSRSGVLVSKSEKKEKKKLDLFKEIHAPKRPKRLNGDIIRFQNNLEKWIGVVGIMDGRPYEIFTGKLENGLSSLPTNIKECEIVKNIIEVDGTDENGNSIKIRKKSYDIEYIDSNGNKQKHTGVNHAFNSEYWNYAKLISGNLRHGMPLVYVYELVNSLNLRDNVLNTWKNGIARVIKRYIKDGESIKGKCPDCGGENLEFIEGCLTCKSCGSSACG